MNGTLPNYRPAQPEMVHVPQRFNMKVVLATMLLFAVLFTFFRQVGMPPIGTFLICGFIMLEIGGQSIFGERYNPRWFCFFLGSIYWTGALLFMAWQAERYVDHISWLVGALFMTIGGGMIGYCVGVMVASPFLFLLADKPAQRKLPPVLGPAAPQGNERA